MDAAAVYEVSLESHRWPWIRPLRVVGSLVGAAVGLGKMPPVGDCVVRRRSDGRELLRFADDGPTYDNMRRQLASMTAAEFATTWALED